eukprot:m.24877 g.24877  ORF g.24877 m.24877 type:complete len:525 (-) comp9144_c0_seq1:8-1582(-)
MKGIGVVVEELVAKAQQFQHLNFLIKTSSYRCLNHSNSNNSIHNDNNKYCTNEYGIGLLESSDKNVSKETTCDWSATCSNKKNHLNNSITQSKKLPTHFTFTVKDNFATKGVITSCCSRILSNNFPSYNATVVQRLLDAGGLFAGKTTMDEFGMGSYCTNMPETIQGNKSQNPWLSTEGPCVAGGSSGGSAIAVATGYSRGAIGSDTGGSIRLPASYCGVVGFKPSYGRMSRFGLVAYASSLDTPGVLTKTVDDAALMCDVMSGHDVKDAASINLPPTSLHSIVDDGIEGMVIGIPNECNIKELSDEVYTKWMEMADSLEGKGATIKHISLPSLKDGLSTYYVLAMAEASSNLARYTGEFFGCRHGEVNGYKSFKDMFESARDAYLGEEVKRRILVGNFVLSRNSYESYYVQAQRVRRKICKDFKNTFDNGVDALLMPVSATVAPTFESIPKNSASNVLEEYATDVFTVPASLAGLPAISVPCGFSKTNMPIGLQLVGNRFDEETVIRGGKVLENISTLHTSKC